jgi:hypothetical protein
MMRIGWAVWCQALKLRVELRRAMHKQGVRLTVGEGGKEIKRQDKAGFVERDRQKNIGLTEVCVGSTGSAARLTAGQAAAGAQVSWSAKRCCRVIRQFRGPRATDNKPPKVQQQLRAAQQSKSWVAQPPVRASFDGTGSRGGPKYCTRRCSQIRWTCASLLFLASEATGLTMRWRWTAACACACALVGGLGGLGGLHYSTVRMRTCSRPTTSHRARAPRPVKARARALEHTKCRRRCAWLLIC